MMDDVEGGEGVEDEKRKALFLEDDQVEIRFEKQPGTVNFKRNIKALTGDAAVKALAVLVSHLAELLQVHPGEMLAYLAALLLTPEEG